MAALKAFLYLSVILLLAHQTLAKNNRPCQYSRLDNRFGTFIERHIRAEVPTSLEHAVWEDYLRSYGNCSQPTQSFLRFNVLDQVNAVCSWRGGKTYKGNMCISKQPFYYITVRFVPGTCGVKSVREESKHLILGCEKLYNQCLPVHFQGNPNDLKPSYDAKDCPATHSKDHA